MHLNLSLAKGEVSRRYTTALQDFDPGGAYGSRTRISSSSSENKTTKGLLGLRLFQTELHPGQVQGVGFEPTTISGLEVTLIYTTLLKKLMARTSESGKWLVGLEPTTSGL